MPENKENTVLHANQHDGGGQASQAGRSKLWTGDEKLSKMFEQFKVAPGS